MKHNLSIIALLTPYLLYADPQEKPAPINHAVTGTVSISYEELRRIEDAARQNQKQMPELGSLLQSATYFLDASIDRPRLRAELRVFQFSGEQQATALLSGGASVVDLLPADSLLLVKNDLCLITNKIGKYDVSCGIVPTDDSSLVLLPCANAVLKVGGLADGTVMEIGIDEKVQIVDNERSIVIPARGAKLSWKRISGEAARELAKPEQPSLWTWQHEVAVAESDGVLHYRCFSHAETSSGDTRTAVLDLPSSVTNITASGDGLLSQEIVQGLNGSRQISLQWQLGREASRELELCYHVSVSSLAATWTLVAPKGTDAQPNTYQFYLADQPKRRFSGKSVTGAFTTDSLRRSVASALKGLAYHLVRSETGTVEVSQQLMPVAVTDDALIKSAEWQSSIESDGAMKTTGCLEIEHRSGARLTLTLPEGAVLQACEVNGIDTSPMLDGKAGFVLSLPAQEKGKACSKLSIAYSGKSGKFEPLEGQLSIELPKMTFFINRLKWRIVIPPAYSAEVAGNLIRPVGQEGAPNIITLEKNNSRSEQPLAEIFYNRNNTVK